MIENYHPEYAYNPAYIAKAIFPISFVVSFHGSEKDLEAVPLEKYEI